MELTHTHTHSDLVLPGGAEIAEVFSERLPSFYLLYITHAPTLQKVQSAKTHIPKLRLQPLTSQFLQCFSQSSPGRGQSRKSDLVNFRGPD